MSDTTPPKRAPRKPAAKKATTGASDTPKPRKPRVPSATKNSTGTKSTGATRRTTTRKSNPPAGGNAGKLWLIAPLVVVLGLAYWFYGGLWQTLDIPAAGYRLHIEKGESYAEALEDLESKDVIASALLAKVYLKFHKSKPLQTGTYLFKPPLTAAKLLNQLASGEGLIMTKITVIEGTTFKQLRQQLAANKDVRQTLLGKTEAEVLALAGVVEGHPEGLFAPDTYIFPPDESDVKILKRLYQQQQKILQKAWDKRDANLPYQTPYEALIMASIVEKETGNKEERPQIAGVFIRRLQQGMRLQTDPTVIYGMGDNYTGNIRKADLLAYTPYNTYRINGLPPTPIALPSKAAIEAALHPAPGNAVYFVAKGDGSGRHNFSATLSEHNQAVNAYLQARKGN